MSQLIVPTSVAIQGELGSFHHGAVLDLYPNTDIGIVPCKTFADVFKAVDAGDASHGIVATENNLFGSINETYGLFQRYPQMRVSREVRKRIGQCLIASGEITLEEIQAADGQIHVLSQTPAIAQVEGWLGSHIPDAHIEHTQDTAWSVAEIMRRKDPHTLAIAGLTAARLHGAHVVATDINDDPHNYTKFFLFGSGPQPNPNATASSIIVDTTEIKDRPGVQLSILAVFFVLGINLKKNHNHPRGGSDEKYDFYIDADAPLESRKMRTALWAIRKMGFGAQELGSYDRMAA
jgi:prephenate dehydratase